MSTGYKIKDQERWCFINTSGSWWNQEIVAYATINGGYIGDKYYIWTEGWADKLGKRY